MSQEKIILVEDAEKLIEQVSLEAWKVNDQKYFIKKESAIEFVTTHKKCECGELMDKYRSKCRKCQSEEWSKQSTLRYNKKPFQEWNGEDMLCIFDDDKFFSDVESIFDYLDDFNHGNDEDSLIKLEDLQLCICEPNSPPLVDYNVFCEELLPEDVDDISDLAPEIIKKVDELNEFIKTQKPISWSEGPFRTTLKTEDYDS